MWFLCDRLLMDLLRSDPAFLSSAGIGPCVIDNPCPLSPRLHRERQARLTGEDVQWLRECGVAWEQEPASQLPLDFCGGLETVHMTHILSEVPMKKECSSCNGTGKCPQCKGTGRLGYPGYGQADAYKTPCLACQQSGVCRVCRGTGQK